MNTFTKIPELTGKKIVQIVGGAYNTVARSADGKVYVWGRPDLSGLGLEAESNGAKTKDIAQPTLVRSSEI